VSASIRFFRFSRVVAAAAVVGSLCCAGPARAGGSAGDFPTLRTALDGVCATVGMTPCPQLPTVTQIILEMSGLMNSAPDDVRNINSPVTCGYLYFSPSPELGPFPCTTVAVNAVNAPVKSPPEDTLAISYLTPLAFKPGAQVTQYRDPAATRFLYAAVIEGSDGQPQILDLVLDDISDTKKQFSKGPVIAFSLPLVMLQNKSETPIPATLLLTATCNGAANCLTGTVTGIPNTGTKPLTASQLGIQFNSSFGTSPNSTTSHRQYELQIPIIATPENDPAYFGNPTSLACPNANEAANPQSGYCNAFSNSKPAIGFSARILGSGASVGVAPYAAPLCPANKCPATPPTTTYFGFCASYPNPPPATTFSSAAATFLQIGTDGTTSLSTPVSTQGIQCPPVN
jgi:hypothetical protein